MGWGGIKDELEVLMESKNYCNQDTREKSNGKIKNVVNGELDSLHGEWSCGQLLLKCLRVWLWEWIDWGKEKSSITLMSKSR